MDNTPISDENSVAPRPLSDIDRGIIETLKDDPQTTNKAIAARLDISEAAVAQRIRTMSEFNVMRVVAQRDVFSDGYSLMCFADISVAGNADLVAARIAGLRETISVSQSIGTPQLLVNVRALDRRHLNEILYDQIGTIPGVESVQAHLCLNILKLESGYGDLVNRLPPAAFDLPEGRDGRIVQMLLEDGRISNREIARQLEISEGAVRQRLKKLNDAKEMRLGVVCDPVRLNQSSIGLIRLSLKPVLRTETIRILTENPSTAFVVAVTGEFDLWVLVQQADEKSVARYCDEVISIMKGVHRYKVTFLVGTYLHRYDLVLIR